MKREKKDEKKDKKVNNPIDKAKAIAKDIQKRIDKAKVTRTKDRRPKIPAGVPTPPDFTHPRVIKKNGGTIK